MNGSFPQSIILFTDSTALGGAELSLIEVLKQLREWGVDCYLVTAGKGELFSEFQKYTKRQLIVDYPYPTKLASWVRYFSFKKKVSAFVNEVPGRKIILVGDVYPLWGALLVKGETGVRVYSIFQGEYVFEDDSCPRKWIRYGANRADRLIASEPICFHANALGVINKEVECLNPKVKLERFRKELYNRDAIRKELGFSSVDRLAICVGQVGKAKGQPWLAEAFMNNRQLYNNWHLLIVGPIRGEEERSYFNGLKAEDSENRLHLLGLRKDVPELYSAVDLAIFPGAFNESFGLAVVEAALMELPILALRSGSIPYNLGEGYHGLFDKEKKDLLIEAWRGLTDEKGELLKNQIDLGKLRDRLSQERWREDLRGVFEELG